MPLVSVIMPVYNAGEYLRQSIESVLSQTFKDFEFIIVDDCSTDGSADVIAEYADRDFRIQSIRLPKNSGTCKVPRDTAIAKAATSWIWPIDADDYVAEDALERLYNRASETETDIALLRMFFFCGDKVTDVIPAQHFDMKCILTGREAAVLTVGGWEIGFNGALIRREIYLDLPMPSGDIPAYIDEYDTRRMLLRAKTVVFADTRYYYRQHNTAITKAVTPKLFDTLKMDLLLQDMIVDNYGKDHEAYARIVFQRFNNLIVRCGQFYRYRSQLPSSCRHTMSDVFRHTYFDIDKRVAKKKYPRIQRLFLFSGYPLCVLTIRLYGVIKHGF